MRAPCRGPVPQVTPASCRFSLYISRQFRRAATMRRLRLVSAAAAADLIVARECAALATRAARLSSEDRQALVHLADDLVRAALPQSSGPPSDNCPHQARVT